MGYQWGVGICPSSSRGSPYFFIYPRAPPHPANPPQPPSEDVVGALRMHTHICRSDSFNFGQVVPVTTPGDNGHVTGNSDESSRTPNPLAPRHPGSRFRIKGIFTKQQPIQQIRVMVLATSTPDSASSASSNHESLAVPGSGDKPPGGPIF